MWEYIKQERITETKLKIMLNKVSEAIKALTSVDKEIREVNLRGKIG